METKTTIKGAIHNMIQGNLDNMRQQLGEALSKKAVTQLDERKIDIAKNYFGNKE